MNTSAGETGRYARGRAALARRVGIDTRALAVYRIGLGLLLLTDLLLRSRNLVVFYTDAGVLPRPLLRTLYPGFSRLSIHTLSGAAWFQVVLFVVAGIFAILLLVGYRTRFATVVSFVLLLSLQARNPTLLNSGDSLFWRLLLWSAFLPLGDRWSVDSLRDAGHRRRVVSFASTGLLAQVVVVYVANALFKLRGDLWIRGLAVEYVLSLHSLTTVFGDFLAQFPLLVHAFDALWLTMVTASILLLLLTGWPRAAFVSLFVMMHFGMLLTLHLSIFPLVSMVALIPFLPSVVWDAAEEVAEPLTERFGGTRWQGRFERAFPALSLPEIPTGVGRWAGRTASLVAAFLLVTVLVWNAASLGYVQTPDRVRDTINPDNHRWSMFAPEPWSVDGWYVFPGRLESGKRVDAFHRSAVRWRRPSDAGLGYPTHRWHKYLLAVKRTGYEDLQPEFTDYVCRRWNDTHEDDLVELSIYYVRQPTNLDGPEPTERVVVSYRVCPTE